MKVQHWPESLAKAIDEARYKPFAWGSHDCCTFGAACAEAQTGLDPIKDVKRWTNEKSAAREIKKQGGITAFFDSKYSRLENPLFIQRGDLAITENNGRDMLTVCSGMALVAPGSDGLESFPIACASIAWRVS